MIRFLQFPEIPDEPHRTHISGPYELLDKLGSGGMGVVFRARDTRLHREVAVKLLHEGYLGAGTPGSNSQDRFLREARAASALNHPNICTIHDVGEQEGKPYLVMELLQGQTLREIMVGHPMPSSQIVEFGIQLARAMEEAHQAGIIHRDIKPANIFVVRAQQGSQQIKVLDFGLAKVTAIFPGISANGDASDSTGIAATIGATLTMPGSTFGTIAYMSPEQARGQALDLRTDLFSLTIVSENHLRQSLQYLGKPTTDKITREIAREIGIREGIKAIINGTISKLGSQYIITLEALSTATGDPIGSEQAQATDKDHVLSALDQATTAMRARLGESLSSIQKLDTPMGQATTPSLEAFRAFALGDVEHNQGKDIPEAEEHYRRAIELDPNFAMAWARLGVVYNNSGAVGKSQPYFQKAYELSGNVSEREKLYIAGHYYQNVTGDLPKQIETLELATRTYPKNLDTWVNLGAAYTATGDFDKARAATERALAIQPDDAIAQENYVSMLFSLDDLTEAKQAAERDLQTPAADSAELRQYLVPLYFLLGDQAAVQRQIDWAAGKPEEYLLTQQLAVVTEFQGRYQAAGALYQKAFDQAQQQKFPDVAAGLALLQAQGKALAGMCQDVPALVKQALSLDHSTVNLRAAGLPAALCGETKLVLPLLEDIAKKYPQDTITLTLAIPLTRAADDLAHHRPEQALHELDSMGNYDLISQQQYLRGLAYLDLHDGANAAEAFHKVVRHKSAALVNFLQDYALAQLGLARALAMQGNKTAARSAYQDFFATWKNADPTLPPLAAAKVEFAALN